MYVWIWRHLPGNVWLRALQTLLILSVVCGVLLFVVFPWAEPKLPFNDVTIDNGGTE
jgi:hypothetical protein